MDLGIEGRHALLFDDDASAAFVNSREALVPWTGDDQLLIDRYDVRHLLDRIPPRPKRQRFVEDTSGVAKSDLDRERFLDLPLSNGDEVDEKKETIERSDITGCGSYQAVPFSYGSDGGSVDPNSSEQNNYAFQPPFSVPTSLLNNLPPTEKLHQIMARTAIFVSEHGGQSEIVLRVKQGDNPTFGFLMPDNQLYPYFRFLVDHPQLLRADATQEDKKSDGQENEPVVAAGGALSLLGSVYGIEDDDDNASQQQSNDEPMSKLNTDDSRLLPPKTASSVSLEDKGPIKRAIVSAIKEKGLLPKRSHFLNPGSIIKKGEATTSQHDIDRQSSQPGKIDVKPPIWEPPSFLKKTMDKIVEFILRNGKEFEAVLIEQDKTAGRFPFLLPSNQYHSYYLKVLQEALESKSMSKDSSDGSKRVSHESSDNKSTGDEELEGRDPQRKDKFKMVIGSKKELGDQPLKPVRHTGVTTDEAAAIVLAATRGCSPFPNSSLADSDTGRTSSFGSLSLQQPLQPLVSDGKTADVAVATVIAKTVALAAAAEADSSDASLTKEQKLKAERLRRAKMFSAMIKSGCQPTTQLAHSGGTVSMEPPPATSNHEEREGSSIPFDTETKGRDRNYRKKQRSRSTDDEDNSDEDQKHVKKKHHSDKESRHHRSRGRHHKHSSDSEDEHRHEKSRRHHHHRHRRHHIDSESEDGYGKSSRHMNRRRKHDLSEDEERDRSRKHRRKHRSPSAKREEAEEGEILGQPEGKSGDATFQVDEVCAATVSDLKPSDVTEVPSDLRAKIRAMLLETI